MEIQPQRIEAGFKKRWFKNTLALIKRDIWVWALLATLATLAPFLSRHLFVLYIYALFLYVLAIEVAAFCDYKSMTLAGFWSCVKVAGRTLRKMLYADRGELLVIFIIYSLLQLYFRWDKEPVSITMIFISASFIGYIAMTRKRKLAYMEYSLRRAFALEDSALIKKLCQDAARINEPVRKFFEFQMIFIFFALLFLFPIILLLIIFMPCYMYFSFKEVWWGQQGLAEKKISSVENKQPNSAAAATFSI